MRPRWNIFRWKCSSANFTRGRLLKNWPRTTLVSQKLHLSRRKSKILYFFHGFGKFFGQIFWEIFGVHEIFFTQNILREIPYKLDNSGIRLRLLVSRAISKEKSSRLYSIPEIQEEQPELKNGVYCLITLSVVVTRLPLPTGRGK